MSPIPAALPLLAHSMIMRHQTTMGTKYFMKSIFNCFCTFFCETYHCLLMVSPGIVASYQGDNTYPSLSLCKVSSYKGLFTGNLFTYLPS